MAKVIYNIKNYLRNYKLTKVQKMQLEKLNQAPKKSSILVEQNGMMVLKGVVDFKKTDGSEMNVSDKLKLLYETSSKMDKVFSSKHRP